MISNKIFIFYLFLWTIQGLNFLITTFPLFFIRNYDLNFFSGFINCFHIPNSFYLRINKKKSLPWCFMLCFFFAVSQRTISNDFIRFGMLNKDFYCALKFLQVFFRFSLYKVLFPRKPLTNFIQLCLSSLYCRQIFSYLGKIATDIFCTDFLNIFLLLNNFSFLFICSFCWFGNYLSFLLDKDRIIFFLFQHNPKRGVLNER